MKPELATLYTKLENISTLSPKEGNNLFWDADDLRADGTISDDEFVAFIEAAVKAWPTKDPFVRTVLRKVEKIKALKPIIASAKNAKAVSLKMLRPSGVTHVTITKSVRGEDPGSPWQVTYHDDRGPSGHRNEKSVEAALVDIWEQFGPFEIESLKESTRFDALEDVAAGLSRIAALLESVQTSAQVLKKDDDTFFLTYRGNTWLLQRDGSSTPVSPTEVTGTPTQVDALPPRAMAAARSRMRDYDAANIKTVDYPYMHDGPGTSSGPWGGAGTHDDTPAPSFDMTSTL